jgi:hypothetical protein
MKGPIHTKFVLLVGLDERGAFDLLSGLTGSRPWQLRCLLALIVKVALDLDALRRQKKLGFEARDRCRCQELAIRINDEQIARPVEDDASARPVFVFVRPHQVAQGGIHCPVAAPLRPGFVMARAVS